MVLSQTLETVNIFFSLASKDENLFEELRKHLMIPKRQGLIDMQYDSMISAGSDIKSIIQSFIRTADIIVLLISADFLASDQCFDVEMKSALEQYNTRDAHVITVLLRPTAWIGFPLVRHAILPSNGKAISMWDNLDIALTEVAKGIYRGVEEIAHRLAHMYIPMKPPQFPLFTLPHRRNPFFTDREDTLRVLHRFFTSQQTAETRTQTLYGMGGMGKTLLAIEYAYRYHDEYQAILWLNATPGKLFSSNVLSLARQLGIPSQDEVDERQRIAAIQRWLQRHDRWLLVLDNLENFLLLKQLIPLYSNGHVLLVTPLQPVEPFANTISITPMAIEEGALLLLRRSGIIPEQDSSNSASEEEYQYALAIAQEVEGYPLALDQAGAYVKETQQTLASYLKSYREQQATLLGMRGQLALDHPDPVTTTLSLTLERIADIDPDALTLLYFFAFLYPEALPNEMIHNGASSLDGPLYTLAVSPLAVDAAITTLVRFSLVHRHADATTVNLHRIVQVILKKHLMKKYQRQLAEQAVRLINFIFPEVRFTTRKGCERYLPQAHNCSNLIRDFRLIVKEGPLLLERLGSYYSLHGCYAEAETYLIQALHLQEHYLRGDPSGMAQTLNSLGLLYGRQARYQDAEGYHQRALKLRQHVLGQNHPKTAESLHNLAFLYGEQGDYQQAEQFYLRAISLEERTKGSHHLDVAKTLNNLALIYSHQGRYSQAEAVYHRILTIYERSLPADHPDLMYPLDGLGTLAEIQSNYQRAEKFYQRAFAICLQAFGEMHPSTAHCINKLADIAEVKGNYQEAETLYQRALSIGERVLGPEHPDIALFLNNLAFLVQSQGQYQRAEELYLRALSIYEQVLGPTHPDVASVLNNLGKLASAMKDEERAEKLLQQSLTIYKERLPPTHPDIAQALSDLADLLVKQRRYEEAETMFQQALTILLQTLGSEHSMTALVRERYASLLEQVNRNREAMLLRQAAAKQKGQQSTEPPQDNH